MFLKRENVYSERYWPHLEGVQANKKWLVGDKSPITVKGKSGARMTPEVLEWSQRCQNFTTILNDELKVFVRLKLQTSNCKTIRNTQEELPCYQSGQTGLSYTESFNAQGRVQSMRLIID